MGDKLKNQLIILALLSYTAKANVEMNYYNDICFGNRKVEVKDLEDTQLQIVDSDFYIVGHDVYLVEKLPPRLKEIEYGNADPNVHRYKEISFLDEKTSKLYKFKRDVAKDCLEFSGSGINICTKGYRSNTDTEKSWICDKKKPLNNKDGKIEFQSLVNGLLTQRKADIENERAEVLKNEKRAAVKSERDVGALPKLKKAEELFSKYIVSVEKEREESLKLETKYNAEISEANDAFWKSARKIASLKDKASEEHEKAEKIFLNLSIYHSYLDDLQNAVNTIEHGNDDNPSGFLAAGAFPSVLQLLGINEDQLVEKN